MRRTWIAMTAGLLLATAPAARAAEGDPEERVKALEKQVADHKAQGARDAMAKDLAEIEKAHAEVADPKLKTRVATLAGIVLAAANEDSVERAAIRTLGKLADPDTWKFLAPYVKQPDPRSAPPLLADALEAAGKMKALSAVDGMLQIVEKAKTYATAQAAMKALANYGDKKSVRAKILAGLVATVRKDMPGRAPPRMGDGGVSDDPSNTGGTQTGEGGQARWAALSNTLVEVCNKLTGQNYGTPQDWFGVVDKYKSRLEKELFPQ